MEKFKPLNCVALPIARANVDTDQIVPARYLKKPRTDNFGEYLFRDLRQVLEEKNYAGARIVVAGRNFACGSSREHAVWALYDYGFRAAIAPSFGDIFSSNALKNGFLPVVLPEDVVSGLLTFLQEKPGSKITIDLENQTVNNTHRFEIAPFAKKCLLEGLDEIDFTLTHGAQIADFEKRYQP
jgi:3-isopropylmalate/(R)-2-methylmalate dehydratase small subunit